MDIVPFEPEHLGRITPSAISSEHLAIFRCLYRPSGPAWTGIDFDNVLGCGGIICAGEVGRAWAILSHPVAAMAVHRAASRLLERAVRDLTIRRVEARALASWPGACRWLERLGFRAIGFDGEYGIYIR